MNGKQGFHFPRFFDRQGLDGNAELPAKIRKFGDVVFIISFDRDKQSPGRFDAVRCHLFEQQVFLAALPRGMRITGYVPGAAVQQTVVGAGSPRIDVFGFHQEAIDATKRQIPGNSRPGDTAADNQHLSVELLHLIFPARPDL